MAFKKSVITNQGFDAIDAYHRVEGVRLVGKTNILFQVRSYKDDSGVLAFADKEYASEYDLTGDNPIRQAYKYLKTLPEFADAEDC
jgi:hypothetical protein